MELKNHEQVIWPDAKFAQEYPDCPTFMHWVINDIPHELRDLTNVLMDLETAIRTLSLRREGVIALIRAKALQECFAPLTEITGNEPAFDDFDLQFGVEQPPEERAA